jgi:hypothetical protein
MTERDCYGKRRKRLGKIRYGLKPKEGERYLKTSSFEGSEGLDGSEGSVGPDGQLVQMVRKTQIAQCQSYLGRVEVVEGPYLLETVQTV